MVIAPLSLQQQYWEDFTVTEKDLEFLYSYLLEVEKPQTTEELLAALVKERIQQEKEQLEKRQESRGAVYYPKEHYKVGQTIQFPSQDWQSGKVINVRPGNNPEYSPFEVIDVELENGDQRQYAAGLEAHKLNQPVTRNTQDPLLDSNYVIKNFGRQLSGRLEEYLEDNPDLVRIARMWFPRALLVDINIGHLNLAEAVLDMMAGGPLPTRDLMEQIDMPADVDSNLNEFSLNLALQEDQRFDEVGPSGEVLWYLHRLEPDAVREAPIFLRYSGPTEISPETQALLNDFGPQVIDELQPGLNQGNGETVDEVHVALIYPHWRAGTLPLAGRLSHLFPTAFEAPRIQFTFVDGNTKDKFSGWVVRPYHYIYGLREWYLSQGLIAGSIVHVQRGKNPGEIVVRTDKKRATREWIRTAIIGSDGGIVFSMLKHSMSAAMDERMAVVVSDVDMLDQLWERGGKQRGSLSDTVRLMMGEMGKLSPQIHVHAEELYAGVNILRRCPPGPILQMLLQSPWAKHLGNLYFRLDDHTGGENE